MNITDEINTELVARIRAERKRRNLTQQDLSRLAQEHGLDHFILSTVAKIETGTRKLQASELIVLSKFLDLDLSLENDYFSAHSRLMRASMDTVGELLKDHSKHSQNYEHISAYFYKYGLSAVELTHHNDSLKRSTRRLFQNEPNPVPKLIQFIKDLDKTTIYDDVPNLHDPYRLQPVYPLKGRYEFPKEQLYLLALASDELTELIEVTAAQNTVKLTEDESSHAWVIEHLLTEIIAKWGVSLHA